MTDALGLIQIVKYGTKANREKVAHELKGKFVELVQAKYSKVRLPLLTKALYFLQTTSLPVLHFQTVPRPQIDPTLSPSSNAHSI